MATARWEHFPHQADVGVRGLGATLEQTFEQAALALTAVITDPAMVAPKEMIRLSCEAPDAELLLVDWLNLLIYEMATRHRPSVEVKGATYTALKVEQQADGGWLAQCVVDV